MKYSTAIRPWSNRRLEKIHKVDIVIGIATLNNQETIESIIDMVSEGIQKYYRTMKALIIVADGGSTDDTRDIATSKTVFPSIEKMVTIYRGNPGKSSAYRMIFESARFLNARVCAICDPAAQNSNPEWVKNLIDPILISDYGLAIALNNHHKHDISLANNFAYSLILAFFGKQIRQPQGGDYGLSGKLASFFLDHHLWDNQTSTYGIDLWMTLTATMEGFKVCHTNLGCKKVKQGDELAFLEQNFLEVLMTVFEMREEYKGVQKGEISEPLKSYNEAPIDDCVECFGIKKKECIEMFQDGYEQFHPLWKHILNEGDFSELQKMSQLPEGDFVFPSKLWAAIIHHISSSYDCYNPLGKKVVQCLSPIYFGFLAGFIVRTVDFDNTRAEEEVQKDSLAFERAKLEDS